MFECIIISCIIRHTSCALGTVVQTFALPIFSFGRSPRLRVGIAFFFAIPACIAGFQAAHALGSLATNNSMLLAILGSIAAMATYLSAWRSVTMSERDTRVTSQFADPVAGPACTGHSRSAECWT